MQYARLKLAQGNEDEVLVLANNAVEVAPTAGTLMQRAAIFSELGNAEAAKADLLATLAIEPAAIEALIGLGDLYKAEGDLETAEAYYTSAAETMPGVPTGYLRMATLAREAENRDAVVYWNDLARQAQPGGLLRPTTDDLLNPPDNAEASVPADSAADTAGNAGEAPQDSVDSLESDNVANSGVGDTSTAAGETNNSE